MSKSSYIKSKKIGAGQDIALIQLDRTGINAINDKFLEQFKDLFQHLKKDNLLKVAIITSKGKYFSVGADIKWLGLRGIRKLKRIIEKGQTIFQLIEDSTFPVIAAINGYAVGGGLELALACDLRIASKDAIFSLPEVKIGIIPGWGGTSRLKHIVGIEKAKTMIFTGKKIDASTAYDYNLVSAVYQSTKLEKKAIELAEKIANAPLKAIKETKRLFNKLNKGLVNEELRDERKAEKICFKTRDFKRARIAALFKRKPKFKGN